VPRSVGRIEVVVVAAAGALVPQLIGKFVQLIQGVKCLSAGPAEQKSPFLACPLSDQTLQMVVALLVIGIRIPVGVWGPRESIPKEQRPCLCHISWD